MKAGEGKKLKITRILHVANINFDCSMGKKELYGTILERYTIQINVKTFISVMKSNIVLEADFG